MMFRSAKVLAFSCIVGFSSPLPTHAQVSDGQGTWTVKAPVPLGRTEVPAAVVNGKVYLLGGSARGIAYDMNRNDEYDPATDSWRARAPMPRGLNHMGADAFNGKVYVAGGFSGSAHKSPDDAFFEYDPAADNWRVLPPLRSKRGAAGVAALNGKIHVIGGREGDEPLIRTHDVYDLASGTWSTAAPLSRARDHLVAVAVDGKIHVIGGRFSVGDEDMTGLHEIYDPTTDTWTVGPPMPTPRGGISGALHQGMIFVLGAEDGMRTYDENEAYDVKAGRWFKLKPLPQKLHGSAVASVGAYLYNFAGARKSGSLDVTDQTLAFSIP
jgi:N-acetylneuraminic acid mutarotase